MAWSAFFEYPTRPAPILRKRLPAEKFCKLPWRIWKNRAKKAETEFERDLRRPGWALPAASGRSDRKDDTETGVSPAHQSTSLAFPRLAASGEANRRAPAQPGSDQRRNSAALEYELDLREAVPTHLSQHPEERGGDASGRHSRRSSSIVEQSFVVDLTLVARRTRFASRSSRGKAREVILNGPDLTPVFRVVLSVTAGQTRR